MSEFTGFQPDSLYFLEWGQHLNAGAINPLTPQTNSQWKESQLLFPSIIHTFSSQTTAGTEPGISNLSMIFLCSGSTYGRYTHLKLNNTNFILPLKVVPPEPTSVIDYMVQHTREPEYSACIFRWKKLTNSH